MFFLKIKNKKIKLASIFFQMSPTWSSKLGLGFWGMQFGWIDPT